MITVKVSLCQIKRSRWAKDTMRLIIEVMMTMVDSQVVGGVVGKMK